jgi:hypothetical protein
MFSFPFLSLFLVRTVADGVKDLAADAPVIETFSGDATALTSSSPSPPTGWASSAFPNTPDHTLFAEFATVDLGVCANLSALSLLPAPSGGFPADFSVSLADDARAEWTVVATVAGAAPPAGGAPLSVPLSLGAQGRYLRLTVTRVGGNSTAQGNATAPWLSLHRLQAWGVPAPCPTADPGWPPQPWPPTCAPTVSSVTIGGTPAGGRDVAVVDTPAPIIAWALAACSRGETVAGYRVTVGSAPGLADAWDSGTVAAANASGAAYAGAPLLPAARYWLSVTLVAAIGGPTAATAPLPFLTAKLLGRALWAGRWLGTGEGAHRAVYLRSALALPAGAAVKGAVATFSGLGYGELLVGGEKVNDFLLSPGWTQYNKRTAYVTADVTSLLTTNGSATPLAVVLGDGWYALSADPWVHHLERAVYVSEKKFLLDVTVTFADGSRQTYGSGGSGGAEGQQPWVWSFGAITRAWIGAENIDLTQALPEGWAAGPPPAVGSPSPAGVWSAAAVVVGPPEQFPGALLVAQVEAPTRALEEVPWQTHAVQAAGSQHYVAGGQFWLASVMVYWVSGAPNAPTEKYMLNPSACRPCPEVDACGSAVHVPQSALDALPTAPTNFTCAMLPTHNVTAHVFTFGREFQGFARLAASGGAGANASILICGSRDGACTAATAPNELGGPDESWLTLAGGAGAWQPRFMYASVHTVVVRHGGGVDPASLALVGVRVAMDAQLQANFSCSDGVFEWLHHAVERTQANYITGFPNDPTREKKGWTQDIMTMGPAALFLHASAARMYTRWVADILDNQAPTGELPEVAPGPVLNDGYNGAWWGGMGVWGSSLLADFTGDEGLLTGNYPALRAYVTYLNATATPPFFDVNWGLGDWLSLVPACAHGASTINTPALALYAGLVARAAAALGLADDARLFASLSAAVAAAYGAQYVRANGVVADGFQCTQALALGVFQEFLPPGGARAAVEAALLSRVAADNFTLTTGFVTFTRMLEVLADIAPSAGHAILTQRAPGALGPWSNTAGSSNDLCKEQWDGGDAEMPSLCGPLALWSFSSLLGVRPPRAPAGSASSADFPPSSAPGFSRVAVKPNVHLGGMRWARGAVALPRGRLAVAWYWAPPRNATAPARVRLFLDVPAGVEATVHLPTLAATVTESGVPAAGAPGVTFRGTVGDRAVFDVSSGAFAFEGDFVSEA